jgi:hypothetical protein
MKVLDEVQPREILVVEGREMNQNTWTVQEVADAPTLVVPLTPAPDVNREAILRVLDRAARDDDFIAALTDRGSEVLQDYDLSTRERAALLSGDLRWVEEHVGKLNARLCTWFDCRLQQEIW